MSSSNQGPAGSVPPTQGGTDGHPPATPAPPAGVTDGVGPSTDHGPGGSIVAPSDPAQQTLLQETGLAGSYNSEPTPNGSETAGNIISMMLQEVALPPPPSANQTVGQGDPYTTGPIAPAKAQPASAGPVPNLTPVFHQGTTGVHIDSAAVEPRTATVVPPPAPPPATEVANAVWSLVKNTAPTDRAQLLSVLQRAGFQAPEKVFVEPKPAGPPPGPTVSANATQVVFDKAHFAPSRPAHVPAEGQAAGTKTVSDPSRLFPAHEQSQGRTSTFAGTRSDDRRVGPLSQDSTQARPRTPASSTVGSRTEASEESLDSVTRILSSAHFEKTCSSIARTVVAEFLATRGTSELISKNLFESPSFVEAIRRTIQDTVAGRLPPYGPESERHYSAGPAGSAIDRLSARDRRRNRSPSPTDTVFPSASEVHGPQSVSAQSWPEPPATAKFSTKEKQDRKDSEFESDSTDSETALSKVYVEADTTDLIPLRPTNELYVDACDFNSYRLNNKNARYTASDRKKMRRYQKDLMVQLRSSLFDGKNPISVLNFLAEFVEACDLNKVHEGAARWLFQYYITGSAKDRFKRNANGGNKKSAKMVKLATYCAVVQYFLRTYATDDVIAKAHEEVSMYRQAVGQKEEEYAQQLLDKASKCGNVYPDNVIRSYFAEGVSAPIRPSVRQYLSDHPDCDLMALAKHASSQGHIARSGMREDSRRGQKTKEVAVVQSTAPTARSRNGGRRGHAAPRSRPSGSSTASLATRSTATPPIPANAVFAVQGPVSATNTSVGSYSTSVSGAAPSQGSDGTMQGRRPCRICLSFEHEQAQCPLIPTSARSTLAKVREENYSRLRAVGYYGNRNRSRSPTPGPVNRHAYSTKLGSAPPRQDARDGQSKN